MEFYRTALKHLAGDFELSPEDKGTLMHLRYVLGLDDVEAHEIELDVLRDHYRELLGHSLRDSRLSDDEKKALEETAASFGLNEATQQAVYKEEVLRVVQEVFDSAVQDHAHSRRRSAAGGHCQKFGRDRSARRKTQRLVERFRLLAKIERGDIPEIFVPILLQRAEKCHAQFSCRLLEKRSITRAISYSGPGGRIRIMKGLSWRYGYVNVKRITSEELRPIDTGTLYITNKRLLFNGQSKNCNVPHKKVISFTMYKDGLQIEKEAGRDQYFLGEGDIELFGVILDSLLRIARD